MFSQELVYNIILRIASDRDIKLSSMFLFIFLILLFISNSLLSDETQEKSYDIIIYGGTSSGVMASIQAANMGKTTLLIEPTSHIGGMTSGGISWVDIHNAPTIGGLAREYFHRVWNYYQNESSWIYETPHPIYGQGSTHAYIDQTMWAVEPHVAENIFNEMIAETNVEVVYGERLDRDHGIYMNGNEIAMIGMESGRKFLGKEFIDATYEGDLMAAVGVSYFVGRESNRQYNETLNGIHPNTLNCAMLISPYVIPWDPASGLLERISPSLGGNPGDQDGGVQAYNYRLCLTTVAENRVPIEKPPSYNDRAYEMVFRYINTIGSTKKLFSMFSKKFIPNLKVDANNSGPLSMDFVGMSSEYPNADYSTREKIANEHREWQQGLLWTLQNHPRIPQIVRDYYAPWGLAKDEFTDNENWPPLLYVREARRMVSDTIITEQTALGISDVKDSIGLSAYAIDFHVSKLYVNSNQMAILADGGLFTPLPKPFPLSYGAIIPKRNECQNLLVPVCLSASHVAYGSIRVEPVYMVLGQSAAAAACLAIDLGVPVQDVPYESLSQQLLQENQVLNYP
jgi:hypothetical protein